MITQKTKPYLLFVILIAPILILRIITAVYPIIKTINLSLTNSHLLDGTHAFIGLDNYRRLFQDTEFRFAFLFTLIFIFLSTFFQLALGLLIALFLNIQFRLRLLARAINLIPWAIPTIVAAYAFHWMLDDQFGILSHWFYSLTGHRLNLMNSALGAQATLIGVNVWKNAPFMTVIFLAGLQGIPQELYEAATVDGAGPWSKFRHITLPMVAPLLITMGLYFVIWQLASFDLVYGLTRGGPGITTTVLSLKIFQEGLPFFKFGYASAISVVLMLLVAVVGIIGARCFQHFNNE